MTSDYLFEIDLKTGDILNSQAQPKYHSLITAPDGSFIIADYYDIERISSDFENREHINSPIQMDTIEFKEWKDNLLEFTCDEFMNWDRHLVMIYDNELCEIMIKNK